MSNITEHKYEFNKKFTIIAESEAKITFDMTKGYQFIGEDETLSSEKIIIPEIDAHWIIRMNKYEGYMKEWTCELFVNNEALIKTKKYKASFQKVGNPKEDIVKTINKKKVVGIEAISDDQPGSVFSIHIKVQIYHCDEGFSTNQVIAGTSKMKQNLRPSCWIGAAKTLVDSGDMADFTFIVQGKEFKVHKLILSLASPVFRGMFEGASVDTMENCAKLYDCDPEIFQHLLNFIYKGIVPANIQEIALDLYKLARAYQIESFEEICLAQIMLTRIDENNAISLYEIAIANDVGQLKAECWKFIKFKMMKVATPLEGEPYSVEEIREFLKAEAALAKAISIKQRKLDELKESVAKKRRVDVADTGE